jgi:predicted TIM-barrel fold metal-dependent hydrolase
LSLYELAILGDATDVQRSQLATTVQEMVTDFGLRIDVDVVVHYGDSIGGRDRHAAFAAVYFGGDRSHAHSARPSHDDLFQEFPKLPQR